jgi:methionyl-tRNA formyltransferase
MKDRSPLRVLFMGSPAIAVPSLEALCEAHDIVGVVSQPDRPQGRGKRIASPAVKTAALAHGIPVYQPERLRPPEVLQKLIDFNADLFAVIAYGKILPAEVLALPRLGCINVHASLLPRFRGAAPIQWAILSGDTQTGITIIKMDEGMDTGPMIKARAIDIRPDETAGSLQERLAPLGAQVLLDAIDEIKIGAAQYTPQEERAATHARMLKKEDGLIDFAWPSAKVDCWIRGLDPWPGAHVLTAQGPLKLFLSRRSAEQGPVGEILAIDDRGALVGCGEGAVWIRELQYPGRKRLSAVALAAGRALHLGKFFS